MKHWIRALFMLDHSNQCFIAVDSRRTFSRVLWVYRVYRARSIERLDISCNYKEEPVEYTVDFVLALQTLDQVSEKYNQST